MFEKLRKWAREKFGGKAERAPEASRPAPISIMEGPRKPEPGIQARRARKKAHKLERRRQRQLRQARGIR